MTRHHPAKRSPAIRTERARPAPIASRSQRGGSIEIVAPGSSTRAGPLDALASRWRDRAVRVLVKSFHDDLAWRVQEELVEGYFRAREQRAEGGDPAMAAVRELARVINGFVQGMLAAHEREIRLLRIATEEQHRRGEA